MHMQWECVSIHHSSHNTQTLAPIIQMYVSHAYGIMNSQEQLDKGTLFVIPDHKHTELFVSVWCLLWLCIIGDVLFWNQSKFIMILKHRCFCLTQYLCVELQCVSHPSLGVNTCNMNIQSDSGEKERTSECEIRRYSNALRYVRSQWLASYKYIHYSWVASWNRCPVA